MNDLVIKIAQFNYFSTLDLKSAYHQLEIPPEDRPHTTFEANGRLYQSKQIAFGLTNAVPCFQRVIDYIIESNNCKGTFAYIDNITICGKTKEEHDQNLKHFLQVAESCNLTFNELKCSYDTAVVRLLGYEIENGKLKPNPDHVKPLIKLPIPDNQKELLRTIGLFAYYAK